MRTETSSWIKEALEVAVEVEPSKVLGSNRLWIGIGFPHHTVYFMTEDNLNLFIDNLLKAQMRYIQKTKGANPEGSAPQPKEINNADQD